MRKRETSSQCIKSLQEIEKCLWAFFRLFDGLCQQCFAKTIIQVERNKRACRSSWCCCLIDNQVHDNWPRLDAIQSRFDRGWYNKLQEKSLNLSCRRMPGNGPCPALGSKGCMIAKCRPVTCNTQLCEKMIYILVKAGVISPQKKAPLQIEDIISLPSILPDLFGCRHGGKVRQKFRQEDVVAYINAVNRVKAVFARVPIDKRRSLASEAIEIFMEQGGKSR